MESHFLNFFDDFVDNEFLNRSDTNAKDESFALVKFNYKANEALTIQPSFIYSNFKNGYDEWSLQNIPFTTYSNQPGRDEQNLWVPLLGLFQTNQQFPLSAPSLVF